VPKDRLTQSYRHLFLIGSNGRYRARDRLNALAAASEVARAIFKLQLEGPLAIKDIRNIRTE